MDIEVINFVERMINKEKKALENAITRYRNAETKNARYAIRIEIQNIKKKIYYFETILNILKEKENER